MNASLWVLLLSVAFGVITIMLQKHALHELSDGLSGGLSRVQRETKHALDNLRTEISQVKDELTALGGMRTEISQVKDELNAHKLEVSALGGMRTEISQVKGQLTQLTTEISQVKDQLNARQLGVTDKQYDQKQPVKALAGAINEKIAQSSESPRRGHQQKS